MMESNQQDLTCIRPVRSSELYQFCEILMQAADWFEQNGETLWRYENTTPHALLAKYRLEDMHLGFIQDKPVAAMLLNNRAEYLKLDQQEQRGAMFMHMLTVRREYAGLGLAKQMVDWARKQADHNGFDTLNLTCNCRDQRLRWVLTQFGFEEVELVNSAYNLQRYFSLELAACELDYEPRVSALFESSPFASAKQLAMG